MSLENQEENLRLLALACSTQYSSGHWDECLQSLQGLGNQNDPRIKHNELVVKYYKAGCSPSATESLLSSLTKLSNSPDNQGLTCARYNMAVLKFQLQHFSMAFDILVSILSSTETQEKYLSMRCAFLLIETCMRMKSLDRKTLRTALELLEKALPQLKKGAATKTTSEPNSNKNQDIDALLHVPSPTALKAILHNIKSRLYYVFNAYKPARYELKLLTESSNEDPLSPSFLISHLEFLQGNYASAIKELNKTRDSVLNNPISVVGGTLSSKEMKNNDERHKQSRAEPNNQTKVPRSVLYFNSLGCIHLKLEKYALASFYFNKALTYNNKATVYLQNKQGGQKTSNQDGHSDDDPSASEQAENTTTTEELHPSTNLHPFTKDRSPSILYNMALSLLFRGKASLAFSCLQSALLLLYHQPYLWLRLGECCVVHHLKKKRKVIRKKRQTHSSQHHQQQHQQQHEEDSDVEGNSDDSPHDQEQDASVPIITPQKHSKIPVNLLLDEMKRGKKKGGKILLGDFAFENTKEKNTGEGTNGDWTSPTISLTYGFSCFANSVRLLEIVSSKLTSNAGEGHTDDDDESEPEQDEQKQDELRSSAPRQQKSKGPNWDQWEELQLSNYLLSRLVAHVNMAWIKLQLKDPLLSYHHASLALELCNEISAKTVPDTCRKTMEQYQYLATIYYAQSALLLGYLDKAAEALELFLNNGKDFLFGDLKFDMDLGWEFKLKSPSVKQPESRDGELAAKCSLYINLSIVYLMRGDFDTAEQHCAKASATLDLPAVVLLQTYIALKKGEPSKAVEIISGLGEHKDPDGLLLLSMRCVPYNKN